MERSIRDGVSSYPRVDGGMLCYAVIESFVPWKCALLGSAPRNSLLVLLKAFGLTVTLPAGSEAPRDRGKESWKGRFP